MKGSLFLFLCSIYHQSLAQHTTNAIPSNILKCLTWPLGQLPFKNLQAQNALDIGVHEEMFV